MDGKRQQTSMFDAMKKCMSEAVQAREAWFEGRAEALRAFKDGTDTQSTNERDARYRWVQSVLAKELIGDNRWFMAQATMFGVASIATNTYGILQELRGIRQVLTQQLTAEERSRLEHVAAEDELRTVKGIINGKG